STGATYARSGLAYNSTVSLRKEAKLQGVAGVKVWDCASQCYDKRLLEQGGTDVEGEYVSSIFTPFEEAKSNKMTADFLKFTGKDKADGFAALAWASGIYLRDAVKAAIKGDNNALTRENVLKAADTINGFTADGMIGKTDVGDRTPSSCYMLMQLKDGKFVRVTPSKGFSCSPKNAVKLKLDLLSA